jgi:hypothetical protein
MAEVRIVLVIAPPLLADLIKRVLTDGVDKSVKVEVAAPAEASRRLSEVGPDVVIKGLVRATSSFVVPPSARVLSLSADLGHILGPNADDIVEFTPDALVARLIDTLITI